MLIYFPKKPVIPPSISASKKRTPFIEGFKSLLTNKNYWLLTIFNSLVGGLSQSWMMMLAEILAKYNVSEKESGYIGF